MRVLRYGERAWLLEPDDPATVLSLAAAAAELGSVAEVVPAARTVLAVLVDEARPDTVAAELRSLTPTASARRSGGDVVLDVHYDGADLTDTAAELGVGVDELVRLHSTADYVVAFCGFAPGFAYLRGLDERLHAPRLPSPRTRVPAGSVGIAGEFTGVYPRESPGGWRLLGRTDAALWDLDRTPPALLTPGTRVRFRPA
ncbi:MAG TPA: allophanate hydrolase subunit 1 [Jatrophihabitans sp.]|jgi:KipI family sensor histidine kinase inhibitor|uniref:5-oxoprolinase subunit B family protein n=1 Tax=Jatrophihabitans sp. TaxID=1932789 RepID=UPI002E059AC8|nr:allophanate hydrolase subunit 1 [Jatrophihabitans sp.]